MFFPQEVFMRRDYYLHKRNGIFYVEFVNKITGEKLSARSTEETDRIKAQVKAETWIVNGIPTGKWGDLRPLGEKIAIEEILEKIRKTDINSDDALQIVTALRDRGLIDIAAVKNTGQGAVPFTQFLEKFWSYDESPYIRDRLAHGYHFSRYYPYVCKSYIKTKIKPFFGEKKLNFITTDELRNLSNHLATSGLARTTINQIVLVCSTALKWAFNEKIIPSNPAIGLTRFFITNKERGILTEAETAAVFAVDWEDKRAFVASLVAATTGVRRGECLALRKSDIGTNTLNIAHSYSYIDGLKCPKNGHKRVVPLLPEVRAALLDLLQDNPHAVDNPFIFYSQFPDRPTDPKVILDGLKNALQKINVEFKSRNICFHSWRHWFCSKISEKIDGEKVAKVSGHLSERVFKKYADHIEAKNIQNIGNVVADVFSNIFNSARQTDII